MGRLRGRKIERLMSGYVKGISKNPKAESTSKFQ